MKALIISEDENVYTSLNQTLVAAGYDTIIYKWLLKALDNIEEIRPDCIVVSSSEYPRHWKTLVQFVKSGIGGEDVKIYLYEPNPISEEDREKAQILGITGYFETLESFNEIMPPKAQEIETVVPQSDVSFSDAVVPEVAAVVPHVSSLDKVNDEVVPEVSSVVPEVKNVVPEPVEGPDNNVITNTGHFMFTNPVSCKFIAGTFFDYNGSTLSCKFYDAKDIDTISCGTLIDRFTFFDSKVTRMCSVKITDIVNIVPSNTFVIVEISEIYEEN